MSKNTTKLALLIIIGFITNQSSAQCPFVNLTSPNGMNPLRGGIVVNPSNNKMFTAHFDSQDFTDSAGCLINWYNDYQNIFLAPNNKMVAIKDSLGVSFPWVYPIKNYLYFLDSTGQIESITSMPLDTIPNIYSKFYGYDIAFINSGDFYYSVDYHNSDRIYKIKKAGEIDSTFGVNGIVQYPSNMNGSNVYNGPTYNQIKPLVADIYDNVYVGVKNSNNTNSVLRYNKYGVYDSVFNNNTAILNNSNQDQTQKILIDFNGNIFLVGYFGSITKLKSNGFLDTTFGLLPALPSGQSTGMINTFLGADNNLFMIFKYQDPVYYSWKFHYKKIDNNGNILIPLTPLTSWGCASSYIHYDDLKPVSSFMKTNGTIITQSTILKAPYCYLNSQVQYTFTYTNNFQCGNGTVQASIPSLSLSQNNICANSNTQITITGNLNGASCWKYSTNYDSSWHAIYNDTITVNPMLTTTYYIKGVGYCVNDGSMDSITISVLPLPSSTQSITTCNSYFFNNQTLTTTGSYYDTLQNINGCDSIITLNLTVNQTSMSTANASACSNQLPYNWNGQSFTTSGIYIDTLQNSTGCDSIATLNLTVNQTSMSTSNASICSNQLPYNWNGQSLTASGTYLDTLLNATGCDSIITLNLTVNQTSMITSNASVCSNQLPYNWNGQSLTTSGTYLDTLQNSTGCDSIATLNLTVNPLPIVSIMPYTDTIICIGTSYVLYADSNFVNYAWTLNGTAVSIYDSLLVNSSGSYILTCADTNSCVASDTVNIFLLPAPQPIIVQNNYQLTCTGVSGVSYQWFINNNAIGTNDSMLTIIQDGTYTVLTTDSSGCVGIDTLVVISLGTPNYFNNEKEINIYPNPTSSILYIKNADKKKKELYNSMGQLLFTTTKNEIDVLRFAKGIYYIRLAGQVKKVVVE